MAKFAYKNIGTPPSIDAATLGYKDRGKYYCTTPGCSASMHIRDVQKACACFVSDDRSAHINPTVCLKKDNFKPDQYDEQSFDLNVFFAGIISPVERDNPIGSGPGTAGRHNKIPIRTLKTLYEMCLQYRGHTYNGYDIENILVDDENYVQYCKGIEGYRIVRCTFYKFDPETQTITMNYPYIGASKIKIHVDNKNMFEKCVSKLKDTTHRIPIVIGGYWQASEEQNIVAFCELQSVGKQTCKG